MSYGDRPSSFIKAKDLTKGDKITFLADGDWVEADFSKAKDGSDLKTVFQVMVRVNDDTASKTMTINTTSGKTLADGWGMEKWAGKIANVNFVRMLCFGEMKDVVCLEPTDEVAVQPKEEGTTWTGDEEE